MNKLNIDDLKTAFRKLLSYTYYDKSDLIMRKKVASFTKKLTSIEIENKIFGEILSVAQGKNKDLLNGWLEGMSLRYYPKSVAPKADNKNQHLISNIPDNRAVIDRLLILTTIPVELCILDVAWLIQYGGRIDNTLQKSCYGNRLDLALDSIYVRSGNTLFKRYQTQYRTWWANGIKAANGRLKDHKNVSIINFDISNYYHSISFDFQSFINYYDSNWPNDSIKEDPLTDVISEIYHKYAIITSNSNCTVFRNNKKGGALPFSLQSAHVIANWYLGKLDEYFEKTEIVYYGRYVDDCMLVLETNPTNKDVIDFVKEQLPDLFIGQGNGQNISFSDKLNDDYRFVSNFELQREKLYVYQFDCMLPKSTVVDYVQKQMEKGSEYRFISEDDMNLVNLEDLTLVNALDVEEKPGNRFNILEESRYKFALYLASLARKLNMYGDKFEQYGEVEKVLHYFVGSRIIKHYRFWERIMTIFVLANQLDYVKEFINKAKNQILNLELDRSLFIDEESREKANIIDSLNNHLTESMMMAIGLHNKVDKRKDHLYLDTFMVRNNFNLLPLQEFSQKFNTDGVKQSISNLRYNRKLFTYRWMPYYVSLYSIICALCVGRSYNPNIYKKAFSYYEQLNHIDNIDDLIKIFRHPRRNDVVSEFKTGQTRKANNKITVSVVEMDVDEKKAAEVIDLFGTIDTEKVKCFEEIQLQISKIYNTDIFILPELSLPIYELINLCKFSSKKQIAFVAGMEFVVRNQFVYNHTITCLPIYISGQKDAIPVIRLKNHYAPEEIEKITEKNYKVPKNRKTWQNLYHWHNHIFTTYYCYELANIKERSFFFSKLDAIYCPVLNKDTGYFNNIAESAARDMHCYYVLCNVSHFGDSQITQPTSQVTKNILKVKGGNTEDNKAVTLSATIDVDGLRDFQKLSDAEQYKRIKRLKQEEKNTFKQTPPEYDKKMVDKRINDDFIFKNDLSYWKSFSNKKNKR